MRGWAALALAVGLLGACEESIREPGEPPRPVRTKEAPPPAALSSTPLPERVATPGTRFEAVDPAAAGLTFKHRWSDDPSHQKEFTGPFSGGGVAVGDYDGDGRPDVFLTRPGGGGRLYRNEGEWRFRDVTTEAGIGDDGWTTGPAFVDVDGDGDQDLFVGRFDAPNRLYINDGGKFTDQAAARGLAYSGATVSMAFADVDRDGDLDAYLVTYRRTPAEPLQGNPVIEDGKPMPPPEHREYLAIMMRPDKGPVIVNAGQQDRFFRNENGRFVDASAEVGVGAEYEMGLSARFFDADDDGYPDLYVANDFFGADHFYKNEGGRRFVEITREALPHTAWFSMGTDAADIDGDGRLDLFTADMSGTNHFKQKLSMGDMNDDGWFLEFPEPRQYMRNAVFLNTGLGRFMEVAQLLGLANTDWTWTPKFGDLDEDGREDLFVSNGMTRDYSDSDIRQQLKDGNRWQGLDLDFWLKQPERREPNLAFRNEGDLRFSSVGPAWGLDEPSVSFGAAQADFDGDGDLDLITNDFEAPPRLYRNRTARTRRLRVRLLGADANTWGIGARVTVVTNAGAQVRELALSGGFMAQSEPVLHFGLGEEATVTTMTVRWPSGREQSFSNLAADMLYTVREQPTAPRAEPPQLPPALFVAAAPPPGRHEERPYDDFKREPLLPNKLSALGPGLAWGDVDGDGDADLWQGGAAGQPGRILLSEAGQLVPRQDAALAADAAAEDMGGVFLDADGDGDLDLYVVSGGVELEPGSPLLRDRLYLNDAGTLTRAAKALPDLRDSGGPVAAADFDGDGDLDLFVGGRVVPGRYPSAPESRLLKNEKGQFTDVTDLLASGLRTAGMVTGALWSDADGDGKLDLLVTYEWGPVRLWRNAGGKLEEATRDAGFDAHHGWNNSIVGADFDGDGDVDYVVAGFGHNLKDHASDEHPAVLYYGPFGTGGAMQLVEAKYSDDTLLPVRGLSCSSDAMPEIRSRYKTFADFARATAQDIYGDVLDKAQRFEADTLDTGIWLNQGGRFTFQALPRMAQASPVFGMAVLDADADGHLDLVLAQNFFGPQRETGRMDGGVSVLLRGKGDGTFVAIPPTESGLLVPEDATALTVADLDGDPWPDLAFAVNDGPLKLYRHRGLGLGKPYTVRLKGPAGNPAAVGARVELVLKGGTRRVGWTQAGAGYLSQDDGRVRFGLAAGEEPESVNIRWPDGQVTTHPAGADGVEATRS
ncbi:MAG: FG-GAP-like repeat-containing protein [bacterium]